MNASQKKYLVSRLDVIYNEKVQEISSKYVVPVLSWKEKLTQISSGKATLKENPYEVGYIRDSFIFVEHKDFEKIKNSKSKAQASLKKMKEETLDEIMLGGTDALEALKNFSNLTI